MAYIQRNVPSPNKVHTFSLRDFSGGLNNRSELLAPPESTDMINMTFSNDTVMEKRKGSTTYDSFNYGAPITFMGEFRPYKEADVMIRATDTKVYAGNDFLIDVKGRITGVNFLGKFLFVDGEKIRAYGLFPKADTTYEKITGVPSVTNIVMELVDPPKEYTPLGIEHVKGVMHYNYTDKKMWYEPCQNEMEDTFTGANVLPKEPKFITLNKGRIIVSGVKEDNDNVFMTDLENPYYFPVYLPLQLPPNSDKVRGLKVYDDSIVVGRKDDIYVISGITNRSDGGEQFRLRKLNTHTGIASESSMTVAHNYLFFFGSDGNAYALANTRTDGQTLATSLLNNQIDIKRKPINLTLDDLSDACTVFYDDTWYISAKDKILVYSYRTRTWALWNALNIRSYYVKDNVLIWGDESGRICKHSEGYFDNGIPYEAFWRSMWFNMDDANAYKWFKEFYVVAHTFTGTSSDVRMTFEIDYVDVKEEVVISNEIATWGKSRFGTRFITRDISQSAPFLIGRRGRQIRFTFRNGFILNDPVATRNDLEAYLKKIESSIVLIQDEQKYVLYKDGTWHDVEWDYLDQGMKIYEVNGDYEYRGKR